MSASQDSGWNFADLWEAIAVQLPDALCQQQGDRQVTWEQFDRRANGVAATLVAAPQAAEQDKVAQYLYNCPEYLESVFAAFKAGMAVVNTNYRYAADELVYLWDNGDVTTVVFHGSFVDTIEAVRTRVPRITTWLWVDDGSAPCPAWATPYESAAESGTAEPVSGPWGRSGDHLLLLYTGGTTGMPKGVMWRQDDLFGVLDANNRKRLPPEQDLDAATTRLTKAGPRNMPSAPLMHGTGLFNAISNLMIGGSITSMQGRSFSPEEFLDTVQRFDINSTLDRRRRIRQADPRCARRRTRPMGHLVAARHRVVGGDLVQAVQGRPPAPQSAPDHGRRARFVRSDRHGDEHHDVGVRWRHREVRAGAEHPRRHRRDRRRGEP